MLPPTYVGPKTVVNTFTVTVAMLSFALLTRLSRQENCLHTRTLAKLGGTISHDSTTCRVVQYCPTCPVAKMTGHGCYLFEPHFSQGRIRTAVSNRPTEHQAFSSGRTNVGRILTVVVVDTVRPSFTSSLTAYHVHRLQCRCLLCRAHC